MKGESSAEFIITLIFFVAVVIGLFYSLQRAIPEEASKIKSQKACLQAEYIQDIILDYPGNYSNWSIGGKLITLGFSTGNRGELSYEKWVAGVSRGYKNISEETNIPTFYAYYVPYAIKPGTDPSPSPLPNETFPKVYFVREENNLIIYAGSNSTPFMFKSKLIFPYSSLTLSTCEGILEAGDGATISGNQIKLNWSISEGDLDCVNISYSPTPELIFIKDISIKEKIPIYLGNHTQIYSWFGAETWRSGIVNICELEKFGLLVNNSEKIPIKLKVISW